MKTTADVLEKLWIDKEIVDFALEDGPDVEYYYVKSIDGEWMPYEVWLDKEESNG
tara:strand:+ start:108 stop:272 length:165 start_codon:yes stop_codon:yes gene_type:complete